MQHLSARKYDIVLDTKRGTKVPLIDITAGDTNSVFFAIKISESNEMVQIPDDADVLMYFAKADNTRVIQSTIDGSIAVVDNIILCNVKSNSIGLSGNTRVEVKIRHNGFVITPRPFEFKVTTTELCDGDVISTNEYPVLIQLIERVEDLEFVSNQIFGETEPIYIQHDIEEYMIPCVSVYKAGFGNMQFGSVPFGGDELVQENAKVVHHSRNEFSVQLNDNYKELKVRHVEKISNKEWIVTYKDFDGHLYIKLS